MEGKERSKITGEGTVSLGLSVKSLSSSSSGFELE